MTKLRKLLPWKKNENEAAMQEYSGGHPLERMRDQMNRMFDEFFRDPFAGLDLDWPRPLSTGSISPQVDIEDKGKELKVSVELPGMDQEDVEVSLTDDALTIRGEKKTEETKEDDGYYLSERSYGSFHRVIPLPVEIESGKVKAKFKKGVLTIKLPKSENAKEKSRKITVQSEE
jgi:HSP20 family protein